MEKHIPVIYRTFYHWEDLRVRRHDDGERMREGETLDDRLNEMYAGGWRFVSATACQHRNGFLIVMERREEKR